MPHVTGTLEISLPWPDGGRIPRQYTCDGAERQPVVRVKGAAAKDVAIVMTDPDAPGGTFVHWTRWDGVEGENSFGKPGYSGPCPPEGDQAHRYVVTAYRLRSRLDLPAGSKPDAVVAAIRKLAVESGSQTGRYSR